MQKCIPADMGIEVHRPRDPHRGIHGQIRLHSHTLTQMHKRNIHSHIHAQNLRFRDTGMQTETEKYMVHTHVDAQRFRHQSWYDTFHVNVQMDMETHKYTGETQRHMGTQACMSCTQTEKLCTHTGRAQHAFTNTQLHRHMCVLSYVCMQTEVGIGTTEAYTDQEEQRHSRTHRENSCTQSPQMHTVT